MKKQELTHIALIGDREENFYQLGLKDKEDHELIKNHIFKLLKGNSLFFKKTLQGGLSLFAQKVLKNDPLYAQVLTPYAEGLGRPTLEIAGLFLIPEILSSIEKWLPTIPQQILGCSSAFMKNSKGEVVHGRILDFPLNGSFDTHERSITMQLKGELSLWSATTAGLPFPSLTAMNEKGVTVALHQKFSRFFDSEGQSIFSLVYDILRYGEDKASVLKILKSKKSLTTWGLYLSFPTGEVLSVDLYGKDQHHQEYHLKENEIFYFNNLFLKKDKYNTACVPFGLENYCQMRRKSFANKEKKLKKSPKGPTDLDLLKVLARPTPSKASTAKNWNLTTNTATSVHILTMNSHSGQVLYVPGEAPKVLQKNVLCIENVWNNPKVQSLPTGLPLLNKHYTAGLKAFSLAMQASLNGDKKEVYHCLQVASHHYSSYPEEYVLRLFFLIYQYLQTSNIKELQRLLREFHALEGKLPPYLNDHRLLFSGRLERLLSLPSTIQEEKIKNPHLRSLWSWEQKLPTFALRLLKKLTFPHLDLLDVIYAYYRPHPNSVTAPNA